MRVGEERWVRRGRGEGAERAGGGASGRAPTHKDGEADGEAVVRVALLYCGGGHVEDRVAECKGEDHLGDERLGVAHTRPLGGVADAHLGLRGGPPRERPARPRGLEDHREGAAGQPAQQLEDHVADGVEQADLAAHQNGERDGRVVVGARDVAASVDDAHEGRADGHRRERRALTRRDRNGEREQRGAQQLGEQLGRQRRAGGLDGLLSTRPAGG